MATGGYLARSEWWRWTEYELVGGTHVAPAPGSSLEWYDPFEAYRSSWEGRKRKGREPPYVELARLSIEGPDKWLRWCEEYGLLGILQEQTQEVRFHPHWRQVEPDDLGPLGEREDLKGESGLMPEQVVWQQRAGGRASKKQVRPEQAGLLFKRALAGEGMPVPDSDLEKLVDHPSWSGTGISKPGVRVSERDGTVRETTVTEGYGKFFPRREGIPEWVDRSLEERFMGELGTPPAGNLEKQEYPLPSNDEYYRAYGEPLIQLRRRAQEIRSILQFWEDAESVESLADLNEVADAHHGDPWRRFQVGLESVWPGASPPIGDEQQTWNWKWRARSLYGLLHVMMLEDFALKGRSLKRCDNCKEIYSTDYASQRYCSERCQNAAQQARYRQRS